MKGGQRRRGTPAQDQKKNKQKKNKQKKKQKNTTKKMFSFGFFFVMSIISSASFFSPLDCLSLLSFYFFSSVLCFFLPYVLSFFAFLFWGFSFLPPFFVFPYSCLVSLLFLLDMSLGACFFYLVCFLVFHEKNNFKIFN